MWAVGVIVAAIGATVFGRYLYGRDHVPPMERHLRALEALRDLAEHPHPQPDLVVQPESTTDHVRILEEVPAGTADARRAPRRSTPARAAGRGRRTPARNRTRAAAAKHSRSHAAGSELPTVQIPPVPERRVAVPLEPAAPLDPALPAAAFRVGAFGAADPSDAPRASATDLVRDRVASISARSRVGAGAGLAIVGAVVVAIVVVTTALGGGGAPRVSTTNTTTRSSTPPTTSPAPTSTTATRATVAAATPTVARTSDGATVTVHRPFHLTLQATGTCWVAVTDATGASLFTATMRSGQVQDIPDAQTVVVRLGYTPAMTILVDGVAIDLGPLAQTANVDFRTA